jgi:metallo-beta-lactamase family protein
MKVTFWGAAREVTGSMHLLETEGGSRIVLDCGLFQGNHHGFEDLNREWPLPPNQIDYVILSHAHIDHCGLLPRLVRDGFTGPIFCTPATRDLASIMLADSAHIQEKDAEFENKKRDKKGLPHVDPLYNLEDVPECLNAMITVGYNRRFKINDEVSFLFRDAGHLLGSASITLYVHEKGTEMKLAFTGDIGRPDRPILKDPDPIESVDYLICESTYGSRLHESGPEATDKLLEIIRNTCVKQQGKLIIPAFSVGRTQEVIYELDKLHHLGLLPKIPVYVDSPLAINATDIFRMHPDCFDAKLTRYIQKDPDPFGFSNLHYVRDVAGSIALNTLKGPCIIISASGMIEAGRIKHHIRNHIVHAENTILIIGYCTPYTLGGRLRQGADTITVFGEEIPVRANIIVMDSYSAHGDQAEMFQFLQHQNPNTTKQIFLVHGEEGEMEVFRQAWLDKGFQDVQIPARGNTFTIR